MIRYEYGRSIEAPAKSEVELRCKSQISSRKVCFHGLQSAWGIMKPRKAQLGALSLKEPSLGHNRKPSFVHHEESPAYKVFGGDFFLAGDLYFVLLWLGRISFPLKVVTNFPECIARKRTFNLSQPTNWIRLFTRNKLLQTDKSGITLYVENKNCKLLIEKNELF